MIGAALIAGHQYAVEMRSFDEDEESKSYQPESPWNRSDLRSSFYVLGRALEAYRQDHGQYPPAGDLQGEPGSGSAHPGLSLLTTPIAYRRTLPTDSGMPIGYWTGGSIWLLWAPGEDRTFEITSASLSGISLSGPEFSTRLAPVTFDPTNGTASGGDLWAASTGERAGVLHNLNADWK